MSVNDSEEKLLQEANKKLLENRKKTKKRSEQKINFEKLTKEMAQKAVIKESKYLDKSLNSVIIPKRYKTADLSDFKLNDETLQKYFKMLQKALEKGKGLNLIGSNGTGKTRFCYAFLKEYVKINKEIDEYDKAYVFRKNIRILSFIEYYSMCYPVVKHEEINKLKSLDLLIIDDFLSLDLSDVQLALLADVIDKRYIMLLPTLITSNLNTADLAKKCGNRLWDRIGNINYTKELFFESQRSKYD